MMCIPGPTPSSLHRYVLPGDCTTPNANGNHRRDMITSLQGFRFPSFSSDLNLMMREKTVCFLYHGFHVLENKRRVKYHILECNKGVKTFFQERKTRENDSKFTQF